MLKQNPFSLYDFLGYLVPGSTFLYIVYSLIFIEKAILDLEAFFEQLKVLDINSIFLLLLISYLFGHILNFLSSITVERYSIWTLGYPSKYLMDTQGVTSIFKIKEAKIQRFIIRIINIFVLFPLVFIDTIIGRIGGVNKLVAKKLDFQLRGAILQKIDMFTATNFDLQQLQKEDEEKDWFRLLYHFAAENAPMHFPKIQNYVALFGLARTTTFIFDVCFWLALILGCKNQISANSMYWLLGIFAIAAYIMYICFNKFYRRYSLEALMAFTVINCKLPPITKHSKISPFFVKVQRRRS